MAEDKSREGYLGERDAGVQIAYITGPCAVNQLAIYLKALTGSASGANTYGFFDSNNNIKLNGVTYKLKNYSTSRIVYNLYDVVAVSKAAGYSNDEIDAALTTLYNSAAGQKSSFAEKFLADYKPIQDAAARTGSVAAYMSKNTVPSIGAIADEINKNNPNADAYIETKLNQDGVTYTYTLTYTNPIDGKTYAVAINPDEVGLQGDGSIDEATKNSWYAQNGLNEVFEQHRMLDENTKAEIELSADALKALTSIDGYDKAPTNKTIAESELDFIRNSAPTTDNLNAHNKFKNYNIYEAILKDFNVDPSNNGGKLKTSSLKAIQSLTDIIDAERKGVTLRNVDTEKALLLEQIRNDPELYRAVTSQLRSDAAAGTIAGQRAANIGAQTAAADSTYDESASKLYNKLFAGEGGSLADATRESVASNQAAALDTFINSKLSTMSSDVAAEERASTDLETLIKGGITALNTDSTVFKDDTEKAAALVQGYVKDQIRNAIAEAESKGESVELALENVAKTLGLGLDMLADASSKGLTLSETIDYISDSIAGNLMSDDYSKGINYGIVNTPDIHTSEKEKNNEYDTFVEDSPLWAVLKDPNKWTQNMTEQEFAAKYGLEDWITKEGVQAQYEDIARNANRESNQVFNAAQRAYIAAVTAGDAKTAEQLTRLAASAVGSKSNLYIASALANQFQQQSDASATGRQLATDYQNQQSNNLATIAQYGRLGQDKFNQFYGVAGDNNANSFLNQYDRSQAAKTANRGHLSSLANEKMLTVADINSLKNYFDIIGYNAGSDLAHGYTDANRTGQRYNNANTAAGKFLETQANANVLKNQEIRVQNGLSLHPYNPNIK